MALKNSQYYALMREYEQTRLKNHDLQMKRYEEVYKKLPEFKSLDESISILSVQYGKKMLNGDPKALSSLKEELAILRQNKKNLLTSAGFPKDYLEPIYDCPDCMDTGYIGNEKCHCFRAVCVCYPIVRAISKSLKSRVKLCRYIFRQLCSNRRYEDCSSYFGFSCTYIVHI